MEIKIFTENENLFSRISYKRLLNILDRDDVNVIELKESSNSYGTFWFIDLAVKDIDDVIVLYGFGIHELRNRYFVDEFHFHTMPSWTKENKQILDKKVIIKQIKDLHKKYSEMKKGDYLERDEANEMYEQVADMSDDDAAMSILY